MLKTKTILIPKIEKLSLNYIKGYFLTQNINPIRWAICDVDDKFYIIKVSVDIKMERNEVLNNESCYCL